ERQDWQFTILLNVHCYVSWSLARSQHLADFRIACKALDKFLRRNRQHPLTMGFWHSQKSLLFPVRFLFSSCTHPLLHTFLPLEHLPVLFHFILFRHRVNSLFSSETQRILLA